MRIPEVWLPPFPAWLEDFRVPDSVRGQAYETFGAEARSLVKSAIALAQFHFNPYQGLISRGEVNPEFGFNSFASAWIASRVILIFGSSYDAAAMACAAACLPRLCGVPNIIAICLGKNPSAALLATLELCGIEDIYSLQLEKCHELPQSLSPPSSTNKNINPCRALLLDSDGAQNSLAKALADILPALYLHKRPIVCLENTSALDQTLVRKLYGSEVSLVEDPALCDVLITDSQFDSDALAASSCPPLVLNSGAAAFWIFPELEPNFFKICKLGFDLYKAAQ